MVSRDLLVVAYCYTLICFGVYFIDEKLKHSEIIDSLNTYKHQLYEAKKLVVEYHEDNESLYIAVDSLNSYIDKMDKLDRLIQDLDSVPRSEQSKVLANCYNETNLKYGAVHKGAYDKTTTGICGVKTVWIDIIPELNEDNIDSLYGGYLVLSYLIDQEGDYIKGLQKYKGSIKNMAPVKHVIELEKLIKG